MEVEDVDVLEVDVDARRGESCGASVLTSLFRYRCMLSSASAVMFSQLVFLHTLHRLFRFKYWLIAALGT